MFKSATTPAWSDGHKPEGVLSADVRPIGWMSAVPPMHDARASFIAAVLRAGDTRAES